MAQLQRIQQDIETLRLITEPCACGTQRPSYTPQYRQGVDYVRSRMEEFGLQPREDNLGNLYGLLPGTDPQAPKIISGSHLDSVKCSGAFDGIAGVICALEAARMIQESGRPLRHPLEIMGTIGEEGTRFQRALIGSRMVAGIWGEPELDAFLGTDDGISLRDAMKAYGLPGTLEGVCRKEENVKAFLELHAEQGPILENEGISIGIVSNIVAIAWLNITVHGLASHPGTIPMSVRRDACSAACHLLSDISDYVLAHYDGEATATAGKLEVFPGNINCIPSRCTCTVDIRTCSEAFRQDIIAFVKKQSQEISQRFRVTIEIEQKVDELPVEMNPRLRGYIEDAAKKLGYSYRHMHSGAGHDAMIFAGLWPTAMVFLPSCGGLTHHPDEKIPYEEMVRGANVLYEVYRRIDEEMPDA